MANSQVTVSSPEVIVDNLHIDLVDMDSIRGKFRNETGMSALTTIDLCLP